jgi:hypothetical protein
MKVGARLITICLAAGIVAGCTRYSSDERTLKKRYSRNDYPDNVVAGMKTVGLVVMDASPKYHPDIEELSSALHSQLQSVEGLEVLPDLAVATMAAQSQMVLPRDGLKLADELKADGLFVAVVTDFSPYGEPVLSVALILFSRKTAPMGKLDLDKVVQGGRPLTMPDSPATKPVTAVWDVYDASQKTTRKRIEMYAEGQMASDAGLGWERYYRSMPSYMRFVSYEIVWKLFVQLKMDKAEGGG